MKILYDSIKCFLICISLLLPSQAYMDEDLAPWFTRQLEIHSSATYIFKGSNSLAFKNSSASKKLRGNFFDFAASLPAFNWSLGTGVLFANTTYRNFGIDNFRSHIRYQVLDDISGVDPLSLVVGGAVAFASKAALNDLISFHHGRLEAEFNISIGKEFECAQFWSSRFWGAFRLGIADVGSPWTTGVIAFEKNDRDIQKLGVYLFGLAGWGGEPLSYTQSFHGYGSIKHRSLDGAVRYTHALECGGEIYFQYARRFYAYNFPRNTNSFSFSFIYPFGI